MTRSVLAHYDGKVIVPDEPVDLPVNEQLRVQFASVNLSVDETAKWDKEERLRRFRNAIGGVRAPSIPPEAMSREELYDD